MTNNVTIMGLVYNVTSLVSSINRSNETYIQPGSKFHDRQPGIEDVGLGKNKPVVTIHDGKYIDLSGTVTDEMKKNGFRAIFVTKYNLNQARVEKKPVAIPAAPVQVQQLQEKFRSNTPSGSAKTWSPQFRANKNHGGNTPRR